MTLLVKFNGENRLIKRLNIFISLLSFVPPWETRRVPGGVSAVVWKKCKFISRVLLCRERILRFGANNNNNKLPVTMDEASSFDNSENFTDRFINLKWIFHRSYLRMLEFSAIWWFRKRFWCFYCFLITDGGMGGTSRCHGKFKWPVMARADVEYCRILIRKKFTLPYHLTSH